MYFTWANWTIKSRLVLLQTSAMPFLQSWWFKVAMVIVLLALILELYIWRIKTQRSRQRHEFQLAEQMAELHARALRAQMNPHFIFNGLNSIKLLVQEKQNDEAVEYLNTFSKLIRKLMQQAEETHTTLSEEIHNCSLYLDLEKLRFRDRFTYSITTDSSIDLKMIDVPVLLLQPLVENSVWHGIMPSEKPGFISISVERFGDNSLRCVVDDNGIGRKAAAQLQHQNPAHKSKGVGITQNRIELHNLLKPEEAMINIIDKTDGRGNALGTRVEITLKLD